MWNEVTEKHPGISGSTFSSYVSLWARLPGIGLVDITESFEETIELIRVPAMRNSVIVFTPQVYGRVFPAFKENLDKASATYLKRESVDEVLLGAIAEEIVQVLGDEDLLGTDIGRRLKRFKTLDPKTLTAVLTMLCARGVLIRARVRGGYASSRVTYAVWNKWTSPLPPVENRFRSAVSELATLYFDAYPEATVQDFRWWGGWAESELSRLEQELEYSRLVSNAKPLDETWAGWHLLPRLDALTMAYQARQVWLPLEWTDWVFDEAGNSTSVILRDGRAVGIWDLIKLDDPLHEVRVAFFDKKQRVSFELEQVITMLAAFLDIEVENVVQVRPARTLKTAGASAFLSPLKDAIPE